MDSDATRPYINQFGEYCGFNWNTGETQECLYPYIAMNYSNLVFIYAHDVSEGDKEKAIAKYYHALYWRNGKAYENAKSSSLTYDKKFESIKDISESLIKNQW